MTFIASAATDSQKAVPTTVIIFRIQHLALSLLEWERRQLFFNVRRAFDKQGGTGHFTHDHIILIAADVLEGDNSVSGRDLLSRRRDNGRLDVDGVAVKDRRGSLTFS